VGVSRLAADVVGELRLNDEPLLAEVLGFIEERHAEPISLRDVARAVSLSPGHLTTVVRRRMGRTVVEWIAERRMAQARLTTSGQPLGHTQIVVAHRTSFIRCTVYGVFDISYIRKPAKDKRQRALDGGLRPTYDS
jgi:AraC-like DNA-binding protein